MRLEFRQFACAVFCAFLAVGVVNATGLEDGKQSAIAVTEPFRKIDLAASEAGRLAVMNARRGLHVKKGELLCELDSSPLLAKRRIVEQRAQSTSRRDALKVEFEKRLRRLQSLQVLASDGAGTPEELSQAEADARVAELNVKAADEELERAKLELLEIDALVEQRKIRASIDGVVVDIHRDVGEFVLASDPKVLTIVDLSRLRASFFLPTQAVADLKENEQLTLRFLESKKNAECTIAYVEPITKADSGRVRVDVILDNRKGNYRAGMQCILPGIDELYLLAGGATSPTKDASKNWTNENNGDPRN